MSDASNLNYLSAKELARETKRSVTSIYRLCAQGLPHRKVAGKLLFDAEQVKRWIESQPGRSA